MAELTLKPPWGTTLPKKKFELARFYLYERPELFSLANIWLLPHEQDVLKSLKLVLKQKKEAPRGLLLSVASRKTHADLPHDVRSHHYHNFVAVFGYAGRTEQGPQNRQISQ